MAKTIGIVSLGCPRNLVDSQKLIADFSKNGYRFQEDAKSPHTLIVNTCAFIEDAKRESIDAILTAIDAKNRGDVKKIIVAGCLAERYKSELEKEFKEVDEFRGVMDFNMKVAGDLGRPMLTPKHYAYIKISEGCANRCAYCVIPSLKGRYKSKPVSAIKKEAACLVKKGARELVLIGQDTSLYGIDLYGRKRLSDLLNELAVAVQGAWIRLLYLHPANLNKDVIIAIKENKNICRYIDLPLEHISDKILKNMNRRITKKEITSLIEHIRLSIPGVSIRTSFIVGFPGETEKDFRELLSFAKDMRFERLGVFKYSREEGTPAHDYKNQVSENEKQKRFDVLMSAQKDISKKINEGFRGRTLKILVEEKKEDYYIGRAEYDAPDIDGLVYIKAKGLKIGNFYDVKITDTNEYDLIGEYESSK